MYPVTETEWAFARRLLGNAPDGSKLLYNVDRNRLIRKGLEATHAQYQSRTSFIKLGGQIYAMPKGHIDPDGDNNDAVLGSGTFGRVKYLLDESGVRSTVKIENSLGEDEDENDTRRRENERARWFNRGLSTGWAARVNPRSDAKFYTQMKDLGFSLQDILHDHVDTLSNDERMDMGIDLCLTVFYLHATAPRAAHLDLKPGNCTIDAEGCVHLVDFATMEDQPESLLRTNDGTYIFRPPPNELMSKKQYDILALKRSLFMPRTFLYCNGTYTFKNDHKARKLCILSPELLKTYNLSSTLDTSLARRKTAQSFIRDNTSALHLAAILITARFELPIAYSALKKDTVLCLRIVELYQSVGSAKDMENALKNSLTALDKALLINRVLKLGETPLTLQQSPALVSLIIKLENKGLIQHYGKLRDRPEICAKIQPSLPPVFYKYFNRFLEAIPAESEHLDRMLNLFFNKRQIVKILVRRDITEALYSTVLSKEQEDLLIACDRDPTICYPDPHMSNLLFHDYIPRILCAEELYPSAEINAVKAISAVLKSNCERKSSWVRRLGTTSNPEATQIFLEAACLLADKGVLGETFDTTLDLFGNPDRPVNELNDRLEQLKNTLKPKDRKLAQPLSGRDSFDEEEQPKRARTHGM